MKKRGRQGKKGKRTKGMKSKGKKGEKKKNGKGNNQKGKKGERSKKHGYRKSERQTVSVPATCSADKCTDTDYVNLFNAYKKVIKSKIEHGWIRFIVSL